MVPYLFLHSAAHSVLLKRKKGNFSSLLNVKRTRFLSIRVSLEAGCCLALGKWTWAGGGRAGCWYWGQGHISLSLKSGGLARLRQPTAHAHLPTDRALFQSWELAPWGGRAPGGCFSLGPCGTARQRLPLRAEGAGLCGTAGSHWCARPLVGGVAAGRGRAACLFAPPPPSALTEALQRKARPAAQRSPPLLRGYSGRPQRSPCQHAPGHLRERAVPGLTGRLGAAGLQGVRRGQRPGRGTRARGWDCGRVPG